MLGKEKSLDLYSYSSPGGKIPEPINNILRNDYTTGSLVLKAGEHYYISGSQHLNGEKEFNAVHDTIVIWLQNPPGIKKWPVEKKSFKI